LLQWLSVIESGIMEILIVDTNMFMVTFLSRHGAARTPIVVAFAVGAILVWFGEVRCICSLAFLKKYS
jgi:hypothetical protein